MPGGGGRAHPSRPGLRAGGALTALGLVSPAPFSGQLRTGLGAPPRAIAPFIETGSSGFGSAHSPTLPFPRKEGAWLRGVDSCPGIQVPGSAHLGSRPRSEVRGQGPSGRGSRGKREVWVGGGWPLRSRSCRGASAQTPERVPFSRRPARAWGWPAGGGFQCDRPGPRAAVLFPPEPGPQRSPASLEAAGWEAARLGKFWTPVSPGLRGLVLCPGRSALMVAWA